MISILKKYKLAVLFLSLAVVVVVYIILYKRPISEAPTTSPTPAQTNLPLRLLSKSPSEEEVHSAVTVVPIVFVFNRNINPDLIEYSVSPEWETKVKFDPLAPSQFSIIPIYGWEENTEYLIKISKVISTDGQTLEGPVETSFTRLFTQEDLLKFED